jgi:hypothetical protein
MIAFTKILSPDGEILAFAAVALISQFGASADTIRSISNPQSCKRTFNKPTSNLLHSKHREVFKMLYIYSQESLKIPEDVKIHIRSRLVTVEGPRGNSSSSRLI